MATSKGSPGWLKNFGPHRLWALRAGHGTSAIFSLVPYLHQHTPENFPLLNRPSEGSEKELQYKSSAWNTE